MRCDQPSIWACRTLKEKYGTDTRSGFLNGNPIVGYSKLKDCVRLMFWSGADFDEQGLMPGTGKFKDASIRYSDAGQVNEGDLRRWLGKSRTIQWDYKNVQKRKGRLERLV